MALRRGVGIEKRAVVSWLHQPAADVIAHAAKSNYADLHSLAPCKKPLRER
jgi:hypothetical protein